MEEGDGSGGGSSPYSETSQEASGLQGAALKKSRWKTAFIRAASPDSNSRGSDIPDHGETGVRSCVDMVVKFLGLLQPFLI